MELTMQTLRKSINYWVMHPVRMHVLVDSCSTHAEACLRAEHIGHTRYRVFKQTIVRAGGRVVSNRFEEVLEEPT